MSTILAVCLNELRRIFTLRPVFSVLVLGVAIYTVFYPQPYLAEALRNIPIAVVDQDGTTSSRQFTRLVEATPDVAVAMVLPDLPTAQREVYKRTISGILVIPVNFEREILHGRPSPVAVYSDGSYFLINQRIVGGISAVAQTMGAEVEVARLIALGVDAGAPPAVSSPLRLTAVPLFNPQGGYATYVLPAAFVLLLQQTLLIGTGLLGTLATTGTRPAAGPVQTVLGKMLAYLALEAVILPVYLIGLPYLYGLPRLGSVANVLVLAIPFVIAVGMMGLSISGFFRSPHAVQLSTAAVGLPFFFLAGFSWPIEAIPPFVHAVSLLVPSTSAISGFVALSQMGAPLYDVRPQLITLWALAATYTVCAIGVEAYRRRAG